MGLEEEIEDLREEIATTPYNKATEAHVGRLKEPVLGRRRPRLRRRETRRRHRRARRVPERR
jgi:ribosome-interacting GTPase 1